MLERIQALSDGEFADLHRLANAVQRRLPPPLQFAIFGHMFSAEHGPLVRSTSVAIAASSGCLVAAQLTGPELLVRGRDVSGPMQVPWGAVLLASAAGGLAALLLVWLANRTRRPRRTFAVAVTASLALSCLPPVQAATTTRTALVLIAMHLIVAALVVPTAARLLKPSPQSARSQRGPGSQRSGTPQPNAAAG